MDLVNAHIIINRWINIYSCRLHNLHTVINKKPSITINYHDINYFSKGYVSNTRSNNDKNNKIRECIIKLLINDEIPSTYYLSRRWKNLATEIRSFIDRLSPNNYSNGGVTCQIEGGRGHHSDFTMSFILNNGDRSSKRVEFKFGVNKLDRCPQWVSPTKPSQYLSNDFELDYYEKVLPKICNHLQIDVPEQQEYLKQVHGDKPKCLQLLQDAYYKGSKGSSRCTNQAPDIEFYQLCCQLSKQHITNFIQNTTLDMDQLNNHIKMTQVDKHYMLYDGKQFHLEIRDPESYNIISWEKNANKHRYDCHTQDGTRLSILLRWKNGNGIAFPAFQIK